MQIGAYNCETAFATAGSGSARWCIATKNGQRFFIKQFLTPVIPSENTAMSDAIKEKQLARCKQFEKKKTALYDALRCVIGDCVVPVSDFFAFNGRYYAVSEYIETPYETMETVGKLAPRIARQLLFSLARCLGRLHAQGVVHADLKPEHVLLQRTGDDYRVRLIDFDSGFLEADPPTDSRDIEGDPVFLAPETFLCLTGQPLPLTRSVDVFAFGAIAHHLWTGTLPKSSDSSHHYLYEAALSNVPISLSEELPIAYRWLILKAFSRNPLDRPENAMLERLLAPPVDSTFEPEQAINGLSRYFRSKP